MLINELSLYKTPLDEFYTNVIDFNIDDIYNSVEYLEKQFIQSKLKSVFDEYYQPLRIVSGTKSVKSDINNLVITVNKPLSQVMEYNYCIISFGMPTFYFIENVVSENDNPLKPSSTLYLKYDVWNNYMYELITTKYHGYTTTRHFDRVAGIGLEGKLFYNTYTLSSQNLDHEITNEIVGDRYQILYCIYELTDPKLTLFDKEGNRINYGKKVDITINDTTETCNILKEYDYLTPYYNKNLIYIPFALFDTLLNKFVKANFIGLTYEKNGIRINGVHKVFNSLPEFPILPQFHSYTAKIHLSFYSPFTYTINETDEINIYFDDITTLIFSEINNRYYVCCSSIPAEITFDGNTFPIPKVHYEDYLIDIGNKIKEVIENDIEIDIYDKLFVPRTKTEFEVYTDGVEPQEYAYPFNFLSLSINKEQYPLVLPDPSDSIINIDRDNRAFQTRFVVKNVLGKKLFSPQGFYMNSNGTLSFSVDALDDYLIRNGSQERTAINMTRLSSGVSALENVLNSMSKAYIIKNVNKAVFTGYNVNSFNNALSNIYKEQSYKAHILDLARTPDTYNVENGENDRLFQNRLQLYRYSVDKNNPTYINAINNFHLYGYDIELEEEISNVNNRINFDFIKCEYVDIPLKINSIHLDILKSIFIRGVFKNHYNYNNGDVIFNSSFDKSIGNRERKFIFNERYKNWLNS